LKQSSDFDLRNCAWCAEIAPKNIRLAEKYYKFGWDSASREKKSAAARHRLTKFCAAVHGSGAGV